MEIRPSLRPARNAAESPAIQFSSEASELRRLKESREDILSKSPLLVNDEAIAFRQKTA